MAFAPLQVGICCFIPTNPKKDSDGEKVPTFEVFPYNINLNPLSLKSGFMSDSGSLSFLTKHEFDFNAMYYEGIGNGAYRQSKEVTLGIKYWTGKTLPLVGAIERLEKKPTKHVEAVIDVAHLGALECRRLEHIIRLCFPQINFEMGYDDEVLTRRTSLKIKANLKKREKLDVVKQCEQLVQELSSKEREDQADFKPIVDYIIEKKIPLITHNGFIDLMHVIVYDFSFTTDGSNHFRLLLINIVKDCLRIFPSSSTQSIWPIHFMSSIGKKIQ